MKIWLDKLPFCVVRLLRSTKKIYFKVKGPPDSWKHWPQGTFPGACQVQKWSTSITATVLSQNLILKGNSRHHVVVSHLRLRQPTFYIEEKWFLTTAKTFECIRKIFKTKEQTFFDTAPDVFQHCSGSETQSGSRCLRVNWIKRTGWTHTSLSPLLIFALTSISCNDLISPLVR